MSRFLTPTRITTLVLIDLYISKHAGATSSPRLLHYIADQVIDNSHRIDNTHTSVSFRDTLNSPNIEQLASQLSQWPTDFPGRSVYDVALQRLWELHDLDTLESLFVVLRDAIVPRGKISASSPLGVFVRRCSVEFTRLQFADSLKLWKAFAAFRQPTYHVWAPRHPEAAETLARENDSFSHVDPISATAGPMPFSLSAQDTETLLSLSVSRLQNFGTRLPPAIKDRLRSWIDSTTHREAGAQSSQHFLAFFDHWRAGQYTLALESLHQYFDYSLAKSSGNGSTGNGNGGGQGQENGIKQYYQYALLHLSVLHADFECWDQSLEAMAECVSTARENQDHVCLAFALSWQMHLRQACSSMMIEGPEAQVAGKASTGTQTGMDEIVFLKGIAREGRHWSLLGSALLEEAKLWMCSSSSPSKTFECILQAAHLAVQHDLHTLMPAISLFHAACLARMGSSHLSTRLYEQISIVFDDDCTANDRVRARCRYAMDLAHTGRYRQAQEGLDRCLNSSQDHNVLPLKLQQRISAFKTLIRATEFLHRDLLSEASETLTQLIPLHRTNDPELSLELLTLEILLLIAQQNFSAALQKVTIALDHTRRREYRPDIAKTLHLLTLKASIFANAGQAPKGFTLALRAAVTAERHRLIPQLHRALAVLCTILNTLGEFGAARDLASSVLPAVLESTDLHLAAKLFRILGEAHVGLAGQEPDSGTGRKQNLRLALRFLERSLESASRLNCVTAALDALAMKARIARFVGDEGTARGADGKFRGVGGGGLGGGWVLGRVGSGESSAWKIRKWSSR